MSDEPVNSKSLARSIHRSSKHADKNTSRGKYIKQEAAERNRKKQLEKEKEQDADYQEKLIEQGTSSRSKYSKRLIVKQSTQSVDELNDLYDKSNNYLDMQDLLDSALDFIPKNDDESNDLNEDSKLQQNEINLYEIEKLLLRFSITERLDIDKKYLLQDDVNIEKPVVSLSRKSNKHLKQDSKQQQPKQSQPTDVTTTSTISPIKSQNIPINQTTETIKVVEEEKVSNNSSSNSENSSNNNNQSLEDWLDTII